ncbi:MAG: tRNA (adenosine(37)-N6)-threonylcarbamoyltransferase complex dimerization subunit type 1 TsaB [Vampirovibrionales bacterium]|nr:tRNA (adenosine(37)-N6)-threonylcarbamoyltransferase complex dimerization subunit type 1 TsaB [Vampirovibrionales bacterium]
MTTCLYLDTTTQTLLLGLSVNNVLVAEESSENTSQRYHSAVLLPLIQAMFQQHGVNPMDLTTVMVVTGPGSFTGLRTGVLVAKTFAQFGGANLIAVDGLSLRVWSASQRRCDPASIAVSMKAGRNEVYGAVGSINVDSSVDWQVEPAWFTNDEWQMVLAANPHAAMFDDASPQPTAADLHAWRLAMLQPMFTPWEELTPTYLQPPRITLKATPVM